MTVSVSNIKVRCVIGVLPHERRRRQTLWLDVAIEYKKEPAADDMQEVVDYTAVVDLLRKTAIDSRFYTIEALGREAAEAVLKAAPEAAAVSLRVRKPSALPGRACPEVACQRSR